MQGMIFYAIYSVKPSTKGLLGGKGPEFNFYFSDIFDVLSLFM
jgi:hypothetical protein